MQTTIAAIATPLGTGAVSIIRISGEHALDTVAKCFTTPSLKSFCTAKPKHLYLGTFHSDDFHDNCMAVYFKAPNSFTGEDVVEVQCHGGVRLTQEVLRTLVDCGARVAEPGEFSKRAFLNGKMSLAEAEGIVDMINSENMAGLNAGYRLLTGCLSKTVGVIADEILDLTASLEASLDYPEELEDEVKVTAADILQNLHITMKDLLKTAKIGRIIRSGINVAIIGVPNCGKSSLLNAIVGRDRAIVTDIPGTTRDTLEERVEIAGVFLNFIDTAGIRETVDAVETIGVHRAHSSAAGADLILIVLDASREKTAEERRLLADYENRNVLRVYNKCDLGVLASIEDGICVSAKTGENIDALLKNIADRFLEGRLCAAGDILTNLRHVSAMERAFDSIKAASYACGDAPVECTLIDLRTAYHALGEITGATASEDIVDRVFEKFCLGK